jgi:hypothetical protein
VPGEPTARRTCRPRLARRSKRRRPPALRYSFENFDHVDTLVRGSRCTGIAFPIDGDAFRVLRFSLAGSQAAIARMRGAVERGPASGRQNTRDQWL